jgi:hypothetical protein
VARQHSLHALFYDAYYEAAQDSAAHALFCERAYGRNLCQHGVADMNQIQLLIDAQGIDQTTSLLELRGRFYAEGSVFLFKNRLADCDGAPNIQRYLYLVRPT